MVSQVAQFSEPWAQILSLLFVQKGGQRSIRSISPRKNQAPRSLLQLALVLFPRVLTMCTHSHTFAHPYTQS